MSYEIFLTTGAQTVDGRFFTVELPDCQGNVDSIPLAAAYVNITLLQATGAILNANCDSITRKSDLAFTLFNIPSECSFTVELQFSGNFF